MSDLLSNPSIAALPLWISRLTIPVFWLSHLQFVLQILFSSRIKTLRLKLPLLALSLINIFHLKLSPLLVSSLMNTPHQRLVPVQVSVIATPFDDTNNLLNSNAKFASTMFSPWLM